MYRTLRGNDKQVQPLFCDQGVDSNSVLPFFVEFSEDPSKLRLSSVDLSLSTHNDLGAVAFNVVDTRGERYGEGTIRGSQERISIDVEEGTDLIVHIESERATNAYIPLGCVAIATTRALDATNEFNLLTKE